MQEKTNMNELYNKIMQFRTRNPKHFALIRIREKYEIIVRRIESKKIDEANYLLCELKSFVPSVCKRYGVSKLELIEFCRENNMKLNIN